MNRYLTAIIPIALVIWIGTTLLFIRTSQEAYAAFEEEKLDTIVNYAVDAAVDEMVQMTADLGMDYADYESLKVDPNVALDMFATMMSKGMEMSSVGETLVKTKYLPMFCVASYDGFYIAQPLAKSNSSSGVSYDSVFTIKQPYTYKDSAGKIYALNLGLSECRTLKGSKVDYEKSGLSKEEQLRIINSRVSDAMMKTVWEQQQGKMLHTIYVPSEMGKVASTNPIKNVTVMAYVSNIPLGWGKCIESFGIGGAKITHERYVVCYEKNGKKMYTYSDAKNVIRDESNKEVAVSDGITRSNIIEVLDNPTRAAEKGYYFDYDYFKGD